MLISDDNDLHRVQLWHSLSWLLHLWYNSLQNLISFYFFPLHMWMVPLNSSSMCWRWRHRDCRCSFICHFVLIYCAGQEEPPWAVISHPGMLWCGEKGWTGTGGSTELDPPGETCCPYPLDHCGLQKALQRHSQQPRGFDNLRGPEEVFDYLKGTMEFQDSIWSSGILHKSRGGLTDT